MNLKDVEFFVAVYEAGSFSAASNCLSTVQSNVSARILALESLVGEPLFERRWRRLIPTGRGDQLYIEAKQLMAAFEQLEDKFKPLSAA